MNKAYYLDDDFRSHKQIADRSKMLKELREAGVSINEVLTSKGEMKLKGNSGTFRWTDKHCECGCRIASDSRIKWCSGVNCTYWAVDTHDYSKDKFYIEREDVPAEQKKPRRPTSRLIKVERIVKPKIPEEKLSALDELILGYKKILSEFKKPESIQERIQISTESCRLKRNLLVEAKALGFSKPFIEDRLK